MKIAVITCYHDPDYVRARTLRAALELSSDVKVKVIKNKQRGFLRYPEVLWCVWLSRYDWQPDAYLLTFRGQEILPFVLLLAGKKPVIFDELIVPMAYATNEHHQKTLTMRLKYFLIRTSEPFYKWWLNRCQIILADTRSHAELSARTSRQNLSKYLVVPVSTDEDVFKSSSAARPQSKFQVFYYSSGMQPLHGIPVVLDAAVILKDNAEIEFLIVGGKKSMERAVDDAVAQGARITYRRWIPFDELVTTMHQAGLCLGGPFGNTQQAQHAITTKTFQILSAGEPVAVGASAATDEYFVDKENALVVPQADAAALAKAIVWAQQHPKELAGIAKRGHELYEKEFSIQAISRILQPVVANL